MSARFALAVVVENIPLALALALIMQGHELLGWALALAGSFIARIATLALGWRKLLPHE